jgi:protease I
MKLTGKTIAILVAEGVEDLEYYVPMMRLQEEGARVLTAGLDLKPVRGKNGLVIQPDAKIEELKANEWKLYWQQGHERRRQGSGGCRSSACGV